MRAGHRHLDGPPERVLPLDLGEIAVGATFVAGGCGAAGGKAAGKGREREFAGEEAIGLVELAHGVHRDAFHERRLLGGAGRQE